ncbi:MAG: hypothetical protein WA989_08210, partial [Henriciella sp.]|uniref:hypothetical protein n=1 Tax=Henriciella sp. TaxID=1968823 RepID=UPI003C769517
MNAATEDRATGGREVAISLDVEAAAEVTLQRSGESAVHRIFLAGPEDAAHLVLLPGRYAVSARRIGGGTQEMVHGMLSLEVSERRLSLAPLFGQQAGDSGWSAALMSSMRPVVLSRALRASQFQMFADRYPDRRVHLDYGTVFADPLRRPEQPEQKPEEILNFALGWSEDEIDDERGWKPGTGLLFKEVHEEPGCLSFEVRSRHGAGQGVEDRQRRSRLTLSIEGRPAIRVPLALFTDGLRMSFRPFLLSSSLDALLKMEALSPQVEALVGALGSLSEEEAQSVLRWSSEEQTDIAIFFLAQKKRDFWAATVAALLLTRDRRIRE